MEVNQIPVPGEVELFEEAELRIFNGGEGLLDFGSALILRMFNYRIGRGRIRDRSRFLENGLPVFEIRRFHWAAQPTR